ncbi:MAG: adenosine-specific kinase [candidate division WOR-3 bacterium]
MELKTVTIEKPEDSNIVIGQAHFIKTVEDLCEVMTSSVPGVKFGVAFCESSGPCLVRAEGNDPALKKLAQKNALGLSAGHSFVVIMKGAYSEVCTIFCATANPVTVILAETDQGRGILGVIDGEKIKGVEGERDEAERKAFLRKIGYKY